MELVRAALVGRVPHGVMMSMSHTTQTVSYQQLSLPSAMLKVADSFVSAGLHGHTTYNVYNYIL